MRRTVTAPVLLIAFASLVAYAPSARAADSPIGTWVKKEEAGKPQITLTIESWGNGGAKLIYRLTGSKMELTIASKLDGTDAPVLVNGKPSGETMAIKRVDKRHATTVIKMNGQTMGTSKGTFSEDFKTLTAEGDFAQAMGGNEAGKTTEVWIRK